MRSVAELIETQRRVRESVSPGQPQTLGLQNTINDCVWQGDLCIALEDAVPAGYELVNNPTDADRQLVPEGGAGSHHRLRTFDGVKLYRRKNWGKDESDLRGPCIVLSKTVEIVHEPGHEKPHGTVTIEVGEEKRIVLCVYQQNQSAQRAARRAKD